MITYNKVATISEGRKFTISFVLEESNSVQPTFPVPVQRLVNLEGSELNEKVSTVPEQF